MRSEEPDVIALQEVRHSWRDLPGHNQARWLAQRLGYHWAFRPAHTFWPAPPSVEGLAFLTRQPLHAIRAYAVPNLQWAGPARIILRARLDGLDLFNVHFPLTERARIVEAHQVVDIAGRQSRAPTLVLGDFNADADQTPMKLFWEAGFTDLWTELPGPGPAATWPQDRRIDYILGFGSTWTGTIRTVGAEPGPTGIIPSDHPGLIAVLTT